MLFLLAHTASAQLFSSGNNLISGNKVGIGTNAPTSTLFIKPPSYSTPGLGKEGPLHVQYYFNPVAPSGYPPYLAHHETAIFVKWNGLIGIHTSNPLEEFHINATIRGGATAGALMLQTDYGFLQMGATNSNFMHFLTDLNGFYFDKKLIVNSGIISSFNNENLQLQTNNSTKLVVEDATGNIIVNGGDLIIKGNNSTTPGDVEIKLSADNGLIRAREVKVDLASIPDYVFAADYKLMPLAQLKSFVETNKHLPNVKSESDYKEEGSISLTEMNLKLLEKVEELTLYILQQQEQIEQLEERISQIEK